MISRHSHQRSSAYSFKPYRLAWNTSAPETIAENGRSNEAERIAARTRELTEQLLKAGMRTEEAPKWAVYIVEKEREAVRDGLTKLFNRRYFEEALKTAMAEAERFNHPLSIVMIDADHFKRVNDELGHPVGDEMLRKLAKIIQDACRTMDVAARYGGEEFAVILPETDLRGAVIFAERLRARVESELRTDIKTDLQLTISAGVSERTRDGKELVSAADTNLLIAKQTGRNRVIWSAEETNEAA